MGMEHPNNSSSTSEGYNFFRSGADNCDRNETSIAKNSSCAYYALADKSPADETKSYRKDFI